MTKEEAIQLWKELNVSEVRFDFICGGDSMGETDITINTENGFIENEELYRYFDTEVYNQVDFYVNSDGHYQGESGFVEIVLEDGDFVYTKISQSQYFENVSQEYFIEINEEEINFLNEYVLSVVGSSVIDSSFINLNQTNAIFNYKKDFILTNKLSTIQDQIISKIESLSRRDDFLFTIKNYEVLDDVFRFRMEVSNNIENNKIKVECLLTRVTYEDNY